MEPSAVKTDDAMQALVTRISLQMSMPVTARQVWDDLAEFLLADERHLDIFRCKICEDVMLDVTVVTKCLHGFCSECIRNHIIRDRIHRRPECLIELGDNPNDHMWHDAPITIMLEYAVQFHQLRSMLPPESYTVPPPPESNTVPPPAE